MSMSKQCLKLAGYAWPALSVARAIADAAGDVYGVDPEYVTWESVSEAEAILAELVDVVARIERAFPKALDHGSWETLPATRRDALHGVGNGD